jgi:translation initiation factor IF-1
VAKESAMRMEGVVEEALGNARFKVKLNDSDHVVIAYIGGKLRQNDIKVIPGDKVTMEISPYDLTRGRIMYRN